MQSMLDEKVSTRRGIMCSHREAPYAQSVTPHSLAHSEAAQDHCILLPLYSGLSEHEQAHVARALRQSIEKALQGASFPRAAAVKTK
jgi:dTDP-4-amino-4,6-dideoxygalactose transaminase